MSNIRGTHSDVRLANFDNARSIGWSVTRSARWAAYVEMRYAKGLKPITLSEAVNQVQQAASSRAAA